jgi:membrane protein required for colicin V production
VIVFIRSIYVGFKDGLSAEIVRLIKNVATLIIALHFYQNFGELLHFNSLYSREVANFIAFLLILVPLYLLFYLVEKFIKIILEFSFIKPLEIYGGIFCAGLRNLVATTALIILFSLLPVSFVVRQFRVRSSVGSFLLSNVPKYYDKYVESFFQPKRFSLESYNSYLSKYISLSSPNKNHQKKKTSDKK